MQGSRDVRETGVHVRSHSAMEEALARRRREDEEISRRRRAHQQLYLSQFRQPVQPTSRSRKTRRWFACKRRGVNTREGTTFGPFFRGEKKLPELHSDPTPEQVFRTPEDDICDSVEVMPPKAPIVTSPWILDAETLEHSYRLDDMDNHVWSVDPYLNLWTSVGLILNDDEFQHVRHFLYCSFFHRSDHFNFSSSLVMMFFWTWSKMVLQLMCLHFSAPSMMVP